MRLLLFCLTFSLIILGVFPAYCVDENLVARQYNFRDYTLFDGLPQGQITAIAQDEKGYLWLGSYAGITRYNGNQFVTYTTPLPSNSIRSMAKGINKEIYIATSAGLCTLKAEIINCDPDRFKLPYINLNHIFTSQDGSLWLAAESGIIKFKKGKIVSYSNKESPPTKHVKIITEDRKGQIWAGTESGLLRLEARQFKTYPSEELSNASVRALLDSKQGLWVGSNNGLYLISHSTGSIKKIGGERFKGNNFLTLFEDSRGIIWMGTHKGVYRFIDGKIERLSPQKGLKSVTTYTINEDLDGTLWFGSDAGLIKYVPGPFVTYTKDQGLSHDFVRAISIANNGSVWMGTRDGISIFNPEDDSIRTIVDELNPNQRRIYAIKNLPDNSVLVGTRQGLIHLVDHKFESAYTAKDGLPSTYVSAFHVDSKNRTWIGTSSGLALWDNGHIKPIKQSEFTIGGIYVIQEDRLGRLWLGTGNQGVIIFDTEKEDYIRLDKIPTANQFTVWSMGLSKNGNIWLGTNGNGLLEINESLELLNSFNQANGLQNNYVWQVIVDSKENVWAFTNNGLKRYDGSQFSHFDGSDGLPDLEGAATAIAEHKNGDLWFGTGFGIARYSPKNFNETNQPPPVLIEDVFYNDEKVLNNSRLKYLGGTLTVTFASLSYRDEREIKFVYRLVGGNNQWSAPQRNNNAQFVNLMPGDYQLQVKAISGQGLTSSQPATFNFRINPPFWLSWWFILITLCLVAFVLRSIVKYRLSALASDKYRLELEVSQRTSELTEKNDELKRLVSIDYLTKLNNRRHLIECLDQEIKRLTRNPQHSTLAFIILDVDHFKKTNDTFGHTAGDRVLKEIASRIKQCTRTTDVAARYGGEEFAVILPFTDKIGAALCSDKMRLCIADSEFTITNQQKISLTISIGISIMDNDKISTDRSASDQIIRQADAALYRAKEQGRNKVCIYNPNIDESV